MLFAHRARQLNPHLTTTHHHGKSSDDHLEMPGTRNRTNSTARVATAGMILTMSDPSISSDKSHRAIYLTRQAAQARTLNHMTPGCLAVGPGRDRPVAQRAPLRNQSHSPTLSLCPILKCCVFNPLTNNIRTQVSMT